MMNFMKNGVFLLLICSLFPGAVFAEDFSPKAAMENIPCEKDKIKEFSTGLTTYIEGLKKFLKPKLNAILKDLLPSQKNIKSAEFLAGDEEINKLAVSFAPDIVASSTFGVVLMSECWSHFKSFQEEIQKEPPFLEEARSNLNAWAACTGGQESTPWYVSTLKTCFSTVAPLSGGKE